MRDFVKGLRVLWMPILLVAFCLAPSRSFATTDTVTPALLSTCTSTGDFTLGQGLLVIQEIGTGPIACIIGTVVTGNVFINDPPFIDGGELSDVLSFTDNGNGTSTATLFSKGEASVLGLTTIQPAVTEDNSGVFPYTLYDPATGLGGPNFNNGAGFLSLSDVSGVLTVSGISDNAYVVVSNTDEVPSQIPEPATLSLMGLGCLALARRLRRKK